MSKGYKNGREGGREFGYSHIVIALILPQNTRSLEISAFDQEVERRSEGVAWVEEHGIEDSVIVVDQEVRVEFGIQVRLCDGVI